MTTTWKTVALPLAGGVDLKAEQFAIQSPKLSRLENGVFTAPGGIQKRPGYDDVDRTLVIDEGVLNFDVPWLPDEVAAVRRLATWRQNLLAGDGWYLYTQNASNGRFVAGPNCHAPVARLRGEKVSTRQRTLAQGFDACENDSHRLVVCVASGSIAYSILEKATGAVVKEGLLQVAGTGSLPRCVTIGGSLCAVYFSGTGNNLIMEAFDTSTLTSASLTILADLNADRRFDIQASRYNPNQALLVYRTTGNVLNWGLVDSAGTFTLQNNLALATHSGGYCIRQCPATGQVAVGWSTTAGVMMARLYAQAGTALFAATAVGNAGASGAGAMSCAWLSSTKVAFAWENLDGTVSIVTCATLTTAAVAAAGKPIRGATLAGHIESPCDGVAIGWIQVDDGQPQDVFVLVDLMWTLTDTASAEMDTVRCLARLPEDCRRAATNATLAYNLPSMRLAGLGGGVYGELGSDFAVRQLFGFEQETGELALGLLDVEFDTVTPLSPSVQIDDTVYLPGPWPRYFDGSQIVELGFATYPAQPSAVNSTTAPPGGGVNLGLHAYKVYYERRSRSGAVERSAASLPLEVTLTGVQDTVTLTGKMLRQTEKSDVVIRIYRTAAGGSTYRLVSSLGVTTTGDNAFVFNDEEQDTWTFIDTLNDTDLDLRPPDSGEVDTMPPPSAHVMLAAKRRLWCAGDPLRPFRVYFSKLILDNFDLAEFNEDFFVDVDASTGDVTGLAQLNDAVIVLTERAVYAITDEGPDNTGQSGQFSPARPISTDVGCTNPRSVVAVPEGVMFQSSRGIVLLGPSGLIDEFGGELGIVEDVTSVCLVPGGYEVRFQTAERTLMYDRRVKQWSVWSTKGDAGIVWQSKHVYGDVDGLLRAQGDGYTDAGAWYGLRADTAWVKVESTVPHVRFREIGLVGRYWSPHVWRVRPAYDYSEIFESGLEFDPSGTMADEAENEGHIWRARFVRQRAAAIRLSIEEVERSPFGRALDLVSLDLTIGMEAGGVRRLSAGRSR